MHRMVFLLMVLSTLLVTPSATAEVPGMLIERRLAEHVPLAVGDTVRVRALGEAEEHRFYVEGVFERAADPARIARNEFEVRFHLPDLEAMLPTRDRVDRFALILAPGTSPDEVGRWIEALAYGTRAYTVAEVAEGSSATFRVISRFHRAIGVVTILASATFLLCVMIIRVDERRPDLGMMRLIGVSRRTVLRTIVLEAVTIAVIGSAVGALLGVIIARIVNAYYMRFYDTALQFALVTPRIVMLAALLGLVLGTAAGVLSALRVVRLPPQRLGER
jgi:putative ABC transport system permease protein